MLKCSVRGVDKGYPLTVKATTVENVPAEFNAGEWFVRLFHVMIIDVIIFLLESCSCKWENGG